MPDFKPYFDWEEITSEQAVELRKALSGQKTAIEMLLNEATPERAAEYLKAIEHVRTEALFIMREIQREPMMVHVAGPRKEESVPCDNPDHEDHEGVIQRCSRCGSILQMWQPHFMLMTSNGPQELEVDDVPWWDEGKTIAKADRGEEMAMYEIEEGRQLEKHEMECVSLTDLEVSTEE